MYLLYSLHPKTFKLTARSIHRDHDQAVSALVKQSYDYITKYRGHKDLTPIKNIQELEVVDKPAGFYYLISDEIDDRLIIYEKKQIIAAGYLSKAQYEIMPYLIFAITQMPFFEQAEQKEAASLTIPKHVEKLENIKPDFVQVQQANYMTELHALLKKRGGPVETEKSVEAEQSIGFENENQPEESITTQTNQTDEELMKLLDGIQNATK